MVWVDVKLSQRTVEITRGVRRPQVRVGFKHGLNKVLAGRDAGDIRKWKTERMFIETEPCFGREPGHVTSQCPRRLWSSTAQNQTRLRVVCRAEQNKKPA